MTSAVSFQVLFLSRPSPFKGEGQEGEVRHPQPVMLNEVKHPYWIPHWRSE
jgi:hypothetical protein